MGMSKIQRWGWDGSEDWDRRGGDGGNEDIS